VPPVVARYATMSPNNPPKAGAAFKPGISYALARLHQRVFASVSELAARHGLTALQFTTLSVLHHHGTPLSSSQLARRSLMTAQSMHEVIHRLEGEGLIERAPHPDHGRKLPARLTAKGRSKLALCEDAVGEFEAVMLKGFKKSDRAVFLSMVMSAVQNLGAGFAEAGPPTRPRTPRGRRRAVALPRD